MVDIIAVQAMVETECILNVGYVGMIRSPCKFNDP